MWRERCNSHATRWFPDRKLTSALPRHCQLPSEAVTWGTRPVMPESGKEKVGRRLPPPNVTQTQLKIKGRQRKKRDRRGHWERQRTSRKKREAKARRN